MCSLSSILSISIFSFLPGIAKQNNLYIRRHYLDFIQQMVRLYGEKRADLEEQQLHLNVGLGKIAETVEQVEEMQKSLAVKSQVGPLLAF